MSRTADGDATEYNYTRFDPDISKMGRLGGVCVGEPAPDFTAIRLDGTEVALSDYRGQRVVLETGSVTCPMYAGCIEPMNALAARLPDVTFLVLYVREAHPGERIGAHRNQADKITNARLAVEEDRERRTILVDDELGTAHHRYGSMPNSVHVIDARGVVVYRALWNDPVAVEAVLGRISDDKDPGSVPARFRPAGPVTVLRVLHRAGWQALWDFTRSFARLVRLHGSDVRSR
ncbi:MAG: peroxiredoxin family protein [Proteobacteria bacterium]|nr:peroxiredoxin family protein [Actinomycetes bacterium]MCH9712579.1 peroxiredoxin family protein [Pseudomonadota bacterium]MCH9762348.1 peroxiredoxin family protein [Actinomycetes bacterium]